MLHIIMANSEYKIYVIIIIPPKKTIIDSVKP